ncbi:MAG TPA: aminopeptidase [Solirubrobacteraceae bacterium]|jgi:aminopeptidase|nr:aminopeptidase [Solirubrobacteraceae bacterium]
MASVDAVRRLAELAVVFGANVQPGQVVGVGAEVGHQDLVRAVADAAYRHGARYVDVELSDPHVHRSRVLHAPADALGYQSRWREARIRELDEEHGASVRILGPTAPGLFDDLDPVRVLRAQGPRSRAWREVEHRVNCTIIPGPTVGWAQSLWPDLPADGALSELWREIAIACRLDAEDPVAAWRERFAALAARARALSALTLDAVHFQGPGTDLVLGLPATAHWEHAGNLNDRGVEHAWNLPSEEVFTVPDRDRVDGQVRLTRPALVGERLIEGVSLTFLAGQVVDVSGPDGVQALREFVACDPGAAHLGEVALVDRDSEVGRLGRTFGVILLDENAASHIALGFGFPELVGEADRDRVNDSGDHLDVMIGSDEIAVTGLHADGRRTPLLRDGRWRLDT